jgi:sulfotransferase family protein
VRDPDRWYDSCRATIFSVVPDSDAPAAEAATDDPELANTLARRRMVRRLIWQGTFDGRFTDRAYAIARYHRHIDEVTRAVPTGQLLVFDVKQGWEPLCRFLDVPVPTDEPFPHLNDAASFHQRVPPRIESGAR